MGHNHKAFTSKDRKRDRDRRKFFKKKEKTGMKSTQKKGGEGKNENVGAGVVSPK